VTATDITIHSTFHPHDAPTVGPADQPGTSISGLPVRL
jgi:hypothetical protein